MKVGDEIPEKEFCNLCNLVLAKSEKKVDGGYDRKNGKRKWYHEKCHCIMERTQAQLRLGTLYPH